MLSQPWSKGYSRPILKELKIKLERTELADSPKRNLTVCQNKVVKEIKYITALKNAKFTIFSIQKNPLDLKNRTIRLIPMV